MIYSLTYTDSLPEGVGGQAKAWFIKIRPEYKDDKGILAHELVHVHQFWTKGLLVHMLRYTWSKDYRLQCEIEAYKVQLTYNPENLDFFAFRITQMYNLGVTEEAVKLLLTK